VAGWNEQKAQGAGVAVDRRVTPLELFWLSYGFAFLASVAIELALRL